MRPSESNVISTGWRLARQLTTVTLRDSENSEATILPVYYQYTR